MTARSGWFWCVFAALAMSLGWGLRGSIGGGSLGAMIPGAMIALVLCVLLRREGDAGVIAALGAVGVGFGGQETYGQTVGLIRVPETFWWAFLGFAVKGAVWGLLGGALLGVGLARVSIRRLMWALGGMVVGTWLGWLWIDVPKLVYFSNRLDRPREELWAGLWLGGLLLLAVLRSRVPSLFALYGAVGGGVGFAFGVALQPWGTSIWPAMPLGWWKAMELTFGALLGLSYGLCAWRLRGELSGDGVADVRVSSRAAVEWALIAFFVTVIVSELLPVRFGYTIAGAVLIPLAVRFPAMAWQTAITATYAAFTADLTKLKLVSGAWMWTLVMVSMVIVAMVVARHPRPRPMLLLLTWTAVLNAFRYWVPPVSTEAMTMVPLFVAMAAGVTALQARAASAIEDSNCAAKSASVV